jgi:gamma-D-glutamyl-L-lysine dipeptidyl-peptidase
MAFDFAFCKVSISPVRRENADPSEMVTQILFGEIVTINERKENWTNITSYTDNYTGWVDTKHLIKLSQKEVNRWLDGITLETSLIRIIETPWGKQHITRGAFLPFGSQDEFQIGKFNFRFKTESIPFEVFEIPTIALSYLNAPYLWGGKTPFGIDCSGFTQTVFRFININLPRDASQQVELGNLIEFSDNQVGDLAFFRNAKGKTTHVGIILENNQIIHASGEVRIDKLTPEGIEHSETNSITHYLSEIKRM